MTAAVVHKHQLSSIQNIHRHNVIQEIKNQTKNNFHKVNQTPQILTEKQDNYDAAQYVLATAVNYTKHSGTKILFT